MLTDNKATTYKGYCKPQTWHPKPETEGIDPWTQWCCCYRNAVILWTVTSDIKLYEKQPEAMQSLK